MTDDTFPPSSDDQMLSSYLLGELSQDAADSFEEQLAADPALAAQLDALAAALVTLGGHDDAVLPEGMDERLADRLEQERAGANVASLDRARERRAGSRGWWTAIGTAAAVVAVGTVMATNVLRDTSTSGGLASGGVESTALDAGDAGATGDDAGTMMTESAEVEEFSADADAPAEDPADAPALAQPPAAARAGDAASGGAGAGTAADNEVAAPDAPVLLDEQAVVRSRAALRRRYADAPEVVGLLGMPVKRAADVADAFTSAVQDAAPFAGGAAPADCLDTVTTAARRPLVPARVETVRYDGTAALAYVLVTASPDADELDRVETWVVDPDGCATLLFQQDD